MPGMTLPSAGIRIKVKRNVSTKFSLNKLASIFRSLPTPIIGRLHDDALIFDCRCLEHKEIFLKQLEFLPKKLRKNVL